MKDQNLKKTTFLEKKAKFKFDIFLIFHIFPVNRSGGYDFEK